MKKGALYVLFCYICWGLLPVFWKTLAGVNSLYVLASRIVWSLVLAAGLLMARGAWDRVRDMLRDRRERLWLTVAGVLICVNWGVYIWAVNSGHMIDSSLAYYMSPLLSLLIGTVLYRERLSLLQWISAGIILAGLAVTMVRFGHFPWIALVIGSSFALYGAVKKNVHCEPAVSMLMETAVLAPFALVLIPVMESRGMGAVGVLHGAQFLLLPLAGVVTTLPLMLFAEGIKTTPLSLSGVLMYINPTLQLLLGVVFYHEKFTDDHAILFAFVWTGIALFLIAGILDRKKEVEKAKENTPCVLSPERPAGAD